MASRKPRSTAARHGRISGKIDEAYQRGDFDKAERWDERLDRWQEKKDTALDELDEGDWSDYEPDQGGQVGVTGIELEGGTGLGPNAAAVYAEYLDSLKGYGALDGGVQGVADNLQGQAWHSGLGNEGTFVIPPENVDSQQLFDFAKQQYEQRQALRDRYRAPDKLRSPGIDQIIRQMGTDKALMILGGLLTGAAAQQPQDDPFGLRAGLLMEAR